MVLIYKYNCNYEKKQEDVHNLGEPLPSHFCSILAPPTSILSRLFFFTRVFYLSFLFRHRCFFSVLHFFFSSVSLVFLFLVVGSSKYDFWPQFRYDFFLTSLSKEINFWAVSGGLPFEASFPFFLLFFSLFSFSFLNRPPVDPPPLDRPPLDLQNVALSFPSPAPFSPGPPGLHDSPRSRNVHI